MDAALQDVDHIGCSACKLLFVVPDCVVPSGPKKAGAGSLGAGIALFGVALTETWLWCTSYWIQCCGTVVSRFLPDSVISC